MDTVPAQKKQAASWKIAVIHWLIGGFVIPTVGSRVLAMLVPHGLYSSNIIIGSIVTYAVSILIVFLGAMYSAKYVSRKYAIQDSVSVVKLATTYFVIQSIASWIFLLFLITKVPVFALVMSIALPPPLLLLGLIVGIVNVFVFYFVSRKYI